ncbi:hypothetical protein [Kineococcus indalonis]|uniref:hypothetical protein n=1 Tax=Kineococcus indalonis TaxID=2696566 RepID=UPI0014121CBC|nr:hypothetical protein [Kineococcus indalonis]
MLLVAEGLLMYLPEPEVGRLLRRVTARFEHGTVLFDVVPPWVVRSSRFLPPGYRGFRMAWAPRGPGDVRRLAPHLRLTGAVEALRWSPPGGARPAQRLFAAVPPLRRQLRLLRWEF